MDIEFNGISPFHGPPDGKLMGFVDRRNNGKTGIENSLFCTRNIAWINEEVAITARPCASNRIVGLGQRFPLAEQKTYTPGGKSLHKPLQAMAAQQFLCDSSLAPLLKRCPDAVGPGPPGV